MPTKTQVLDHGGFVRNPDAPNRAEFGHYLQAVDRLIAALQRAIGAWNESPFSAELLAAKRAAEGAFDRFAAGYLDRYAIKAVEHDAALLPVGQFFARQRPIRAPFAVLHCSLDLPLHTVYVFENAADLQCLNDALDRKIPLRWWQDGPLGHPCYLFGDAVWELKPTEAGASERGLALLFEETTQRERQKRDRLHNQLGDSPATAHTQFIPESVRVAVWRRDGGKCAKCGSRDDLDFGFVRPSLGGNEKNVQVLCGRCARR